VTTDRGRAPGDKASVRPRCRCSSLPFVGCDDVATRRDAFGRKQIDEETNCRRCLVGPTACDALRTSRGERNSTSSRASA